MSFHVEYVLVRKNINKSKKKVEENWGETERTIEILRGQRN